MNADTKVESVKVFKIDNWKSFLVLDLVCILCQFGLVSFYVSNAPYSDKSFGIFAIFIFFVLINLLTPVVFASVEQFLKIEIDAKAGSKHIGYLGIASAVILATSVMFFAEDNKYDTQFKSNAITWLEQGNCSEIRKYDKSIVPLCEKMTQVRKNVAGTFIVMSKDFDSSAIVCKYFVQSEKDGLGITLYFQPCENNIKQKVEINVKAVESTAYGDSYKHELSLKAI